jgi:hypothetical protein
MTHIPFVLLFSTLHALTYSADLAVHHYAISLVIHALDNLPSNLPHNAGCHLHFACDLKREI